MEDFTNSSTDYSTACACTQSHFDREKNEFSEVLPLKKPAALQPSLPIVHCDAIYTVRAQNCPLKVMVSLLQNLCSFAFQLYFVDVYVCMQTQFFSEFQSYMFMCKYLCSASYMYLQICVDKNKETHHLGTGPGPFLYKSKHYLLTQVVTIWRW